ncbi:MAG: T9SS type A sorting domain-containing protein [Candidatus Cloacimonetes bacterium]|nr:T9SS type A sorting domain-containing protein [Candidatus Cloacimonadota bacterium]
MNRHRELLIIIILLITLIPLSLYADVNFRVVTYNVLNFSYDNGIDRYDYFQSVVEAIEPDVVLLQEMINQEGADLFLDILNSNGNEFDAADFINGYDTDNMLYYRTSIVTFISQDTIRTSLRDISEYVVSINGNEVRFYSCHLKASQGSENEQKRLDEVTVLREHLNNLPEGTEFIIVGDMNLYNSDEPAYQKFIDDEGDNGRSEDLIGSDGVGDWHDNPVYASVHTQSTRTTQFGGGASGGMDDRFDFIFASYGINDSIGIDYIEDTYTSFGNDGNHLNQSINAGTNSAVPADIADALYYASDHLPVYADFVSLTTTNGAQLEQGSIFLNDFDYWRSDSKDINDFFGYCGVWYTEGANINKSFDSTGLKQFSLKLDYDVSDTLSAGGWVDQLTYSYIDPSNPVYDISEFEEFHFFFKGSGTYTTKFFLEFVQEKFENQKRIEISIVNDDWQEVVISLEDSLVGFDLTRMMQVAIVLENYHVTEKIGTICFDNFYFVDKDEGYSTNDEFFDLISKKAFKYFVENYHPNTGLIRDMASLRDVSSIAGVGFGLAALGIGAARGWITRSEAASRTNRILTTLYEAPQGPDVCGCAGYKGFFYHLLDIETSRRHRDSELSSIDTAILLAGVLFSKAYYDSSNAIENSIRNLADSIYNRVDWNWMLDITKNQFRMAWTPECGGAFDNWWDYYTDEAILICLLAIASGQVDSTVFYDWEREPGSYNDYTLVQTWWGSLFTYFFAHCWINFQELGSDSLLTTTVNWWKNSMDAVLANRQFCIDSSITYATYGENSWGLTACLGPDGYNGGISKSYGACPLGDPPPNHDGTIPPYGAGSSIIYFSSDPEQNEAVKALKNYYDNYRKLWGLYGLEDAYNLGLVSSDSTDDWYADDYIGIDVGPMLIMIENYRDSLIWKNFVKNDQIWDAIHKIFLDSNNNGKFKLYPNYPNPFNSSTVIHYYIPKYNRVKISIYNIRGQMIKTLANENLQRGYHKVVWNGKDENCKPVSSGIYFYKMETDSFSKVKKAILLK